MPWESIFASYCCHALAKDSHTHERKPAIFSFHAPRDGGFHARKMAARRQPTLARLTLRRIARLLYDDRQSPTGVSASQRKASLGRTSGRSTIYTSVAMPAARWQDYATHTAGRACNFLDGEARQFIFKSKMIAAGHFAMEARDRAHTSPSAPAAGAIPGRRYSPHHHINLTNKYAASYT